MYIIGVLSNGKIVEIKTDVYVGNKILGMYIVDNETGEIIFMENFN